MNAVAEARLNTGTPRSREGDPSIFVWALVAIYVFGRVFEVYPGRVPMLGVVALHVFPPAIFAVIHGARVYRLAGILTFVTVTLIVGNCFENLGVRTGFPFGSYYFTDLMGPKLSGVPFTLGLAYVGMAYLSWTLARIILRTTENPLQGSRLLTVPMLASAMMVSWDLSQDPVWSTVLHAWVWIRGGAYFGVPITNFFGWYLTVYAIYQFFAFCFRENTPAAPLPASYWRQAVIFYGVSAAGNLLLLLPQSRYSVATDPTGIRWKVSVITLACAVVTLLTMGVFTVGAWRRLGEMNSRLPEPCPGTGWPRWRRVLAKASPPR